MRFSFLNKVSEKKRFQLRCFQVHFVKVLRTPFLLDTSGQLVWCDIKKNQFVDIKICLYEYWKIFANKIAFSCNFTKILKDRHFTVGSPILQMGGRRKIILSMFWETYAGFLTNIFYNFSQNITLACSERLMQVF